MSQILAKGSGGGGGSDVLSLTGDVGGPVTPTAGGTININGAGNVQVTGNPGSNQLIIDLVTASNNSNVAIGDGAHNGSGGGENSIAIGFNANSGNSSESIAIGWSAATLQSSAIAIGNQTNIFDNYAIGMGYLTTQSGTGPSIFIGKGANDDPGSGDSVICIGSGSVASGSTSVALGHQTSTGNNSTALGHLAIATGDQSTVVGESATDTGGTLNIVIGSQAGTSLAASTGNIVIGSVGSGAGSNISIGTSQTTCNIAGIFGSTVTGSAVLCDSTGLLGTVVSSERYKDNIKPWSDNADSILQLQPSEFVYKSDPNLITQYGLIAEEVDKIMPYLVVRDREGRPESVKYHELPVFLLDIIKKHQVIIESLESKIKALESTRGDS